MAKFEYRCPKTGLLRVGTIDGKLKKNLDKIKLRLLKKDMDFQMIITGQEGVGKCQPKGSKVLMANGDYKNIEDIKIGDIVLSPQRNGSYVFSKVLETHDWFSKKTYDVYEKNRNHKLLYSCSYNHEIVLNIKRKKKWVVEEIRAEDLSNKSEWFLQNITTPTMFPIEKYKDKRDCDIEPYTLGAMLGDGSYSDRKNKSPPRKDNYFTKGHYRILKDGKRIWQSGKWNKNGHKHYKGFQVSRSLNITTEDKEIINEIEKFYPVMSSYLKRDNKADQYRFSVVGKLAKQLTKLNLNGKGSGEKFIPREALLSSLEYRKRLLAGLIDTDGYYHKKGNGYEFTLKSKKLIEGIRELAYSLGGRCGEIKKVKKGIKSIGFVGTYYKVHLNLGKMKLPTQLERKTRGKDYKFFYISPNRVAIELKENIGRQVYGFTLDSDSHWYITDNFCVTHNSVLAMTICTYMDSTFNLARVTFTGKEYKIQTLIAKPTQAILLDEAAELSSRSALSKLNKMIVSLMQQQRQLRLFSVIVVPNLWMLERYCALHRSNGLIHCQVGKNNRHIFHVFNRKNKQKLYLEGLKTMNPAKTIKNTNSVWKGVFSNCYANIDENKYRAKKLEAFKRMGEDDFEAENLNYQRNELIYIINQEYDLNPYQIEDLFGRYKFKLSRPQIHKVLTETKKRKAQEASEKLRMEIKETEGGK